MFEITVPRSQADIGQLILGGMSEEVSEDHVKWVSVSDKSIDTDEGKLSGWLVEASSVIVGDGTKVNNTVRSNVTAVIETEVSYLHLPNAMVDEIHELIHAMQMGWTPFYSVRKEERTNFPDLVFKLGDEEVRTTGYDYTICDGKSCMSLLMPSYSDELLVLGGGFLRGIRTFFDMENNKAGCELLMLLLLCRPLTNSVS